MIISTLTVIAVGSLVVEQVQCARTVKNYNPNNPTSGSVVNGVYTPNCFPAVDFKMPNATPTSLTNWWCNTDAEYAFVGFSYDISPCNYFLQDQYILYAHRDLFRSKPDPTENRLFRYEKSVQGKIRAIVRSLRQQRILVSWIYLKKYDCSFTAHS